MRGASTREPADHDRRGDLLVEHLGVAGDEVFHEKAVAEQLHDLALHVEAAELRQPRFVA